LKDIFAVLIFISILLADETNQACRSSHYYDFANLTNHQMEIAEKIKVICKNISFLPGRCLIHNSENQTVHSAISEPVNLTLGHTC
jgi:hypothetical protein